MTSGPEYEVVSNETVLTAELEAAPFWTAFMLPGNVIDPAMLRAWVFLVVHKTMDVQPNLSTVSYCAMLERYIAHGIQEELKLRVVASKPRPSEDDGA